MHIHYLQHVAFEDAANIAAWARERGHRLTHTRLDLDQPLPEPEDLDWLVVMGGPMNVDEHDVYPWLVREKQFIRRVIDRGVPVLGVCLGGQLISTRAGRASHEEPAEGDRLVPRDAHFRSRRIAALRAFSATGSGLSLARRHFLDTARRDSPGRQRRLR